MQLPYYGWIKKKGKANSESSEIGCNARSRRAEGVIFRNCEQSGKFPRLLQVLQVLITFLKTPVSVK